MLTKNWVDRDLRQAGVCWLSVHFAPFIIQGSSSQRREKDLEAKRYDCVEFRRPNGFRLGNFTFYPTRTICGKICLTLIKSAPPSASALRSSLAFLTVRILVGSPVRPLSSITTFFSCCL